MKERRHQFDGDVILTDGPGCFGTDDRHVAKICEAILAQGLLGLDD
jgi:hypothetical protein